MRAIRHSRERSVGNSLFPAPGEAKELMLRSVLIIVGVTLCSAASIADEPEYFEGSVILETTIESFNERLPVDLLYWWYGTAESRIYKDGSFRWDIVGSEVTSVWYRREENREYWLRSCDDYLRYDSVGTPMIDIVSIELIDDTMEIAGYEAHAIELHEQWDDDEIEINRYWYVPELKVNPAWYAEYRVAGGDRIYEHIDSLVVGYELIASFRSVRKFATEIRVEPVSDEYLALPDMDTLHAPPELDEFSPPCPRPE